KSLDQLAAFINEYNESQSFYTIKAELEIAGALFALDELAKRPKDKVLKLDAGVNTTGSEYAAVFLPSDTNTIFYTSAVSVALAEENRNMAKRPYKSNILTTTQGELGWSQPKGLGIAINSSAYEGAPSITANGKRIYFTRWNEDHKKPEWSIYVSNKSGEYWQLPQKLNEKVNMPGFKALHPSVSPDGMLLFFSSNRPGGYGKMDIWLSILDEKGEPGEVINLGERVNTIEDELSPFFNNTTKTLYYSSSGKIGMGGFDIYKTFSGAGSWSDPENLGYPINSSKDDMFFVTTDHESYGYLSSDREGSCECITGYCYNLYSVLSKPLIITLSGIVYKQNTKKVIRNCLIIVEDNIGNNTAFITDENGHYETELQEDITYYFKTKKTTFFSAEAAISTSGIEESTDLIQDFYLERIPIGEIEIPGILYDFNSASLRSESKLILDELVHFLNLNDNIVIEVASHTDERGNDFYNYKLSKNRAKSVIDYLIAKEIETPRLKSIGFGEKKLLVKHANSEEDHQKNRRTTFKILSEDYISPSAL
ncbi:OmpA family protein, partial [Cytophagaceae bacterium AH-315-L13]|nr:OmpA family protein [Cytophagaceae bacterium AH-315-L13]